MNKIQKSLILIVTLILVQGCATTITVQYESNPSGAQIYGGATPQMNFIGITPYTESFTGFGPYWKEWYYQFKKDGYFDSEIIHAQQLPVNTNRRVWAILKKVQQPPQPPQQSQPDDNQKNNKFKTGTAFFINLQGNIVSNYHVVQKCNIIEVSNALFKSKANLLFTDNINDLAVLIVDTIPPPSIGYFRIGKELRLGDDIIAVGYPLGSLLGGSVKVTKGNISSLTGIANDSSMLQISAPIQPGSSGGPLLDNSGNIVGIVSAKLSELATLKATGSLPQNVNFAIKSQTVQLFLDTHKINYSVQHSDKYFETADIIEKAEKFTFQVQCLE